MSTQHPDSADRTADLGGRTLPKIMAIAMVLLAMVGAAVTLADAAWARTYWLALVPIFGVMCIIAAWDDARRRMTELGRLVRLVDRASATMLHVETGRITPMAVPLMVIVGREALPPGAEADETLLTQAEALAQKAMGL